MESFLLHDDQDVRAIRAFRERLASAPTIVDFEEQILLVSIRETTRLWRQKDQIVGFAFVDEYNNLWFETDRELDCLNQLETEIVEWGVTCLQRRAAQTGAETTLDSTCQATDNHRIRTLTQHGFVPQEVRSVQYVRSLREPIPRYPLPDGFSIRCTQGREEVESLVALHRAAFGTAHMTVEYRLAMMSTPQYIRELDFVVVAPDGSLAAFCVCGFEDSERELGYTDPIGTHPSYRRLGLGKALVSAGLTALQTVGARQARLGTRSDNLAMQKLAGDVGFVCVSEKVWFSKAIP